jgi:hypothetical protein
MPTLILHVNTHVIKRNTKTGEREPPLVIRHGKSGCKRVYCHTADLVMDGVVVGRLVYSPDKPLNCGARVWLETDALEIVPQLWS